VVGGGGGSGGGGGGGKILGSREFARYYRQRPRLGDARASVQAATVQAQYRRLAVPLLVGGRVDFCFAGVGWAPLAAFVCHSPLPA
jgi:pre-60S factor REI1